MSDPAWYYVVDTMLGTTETRGPVSGGELLELARGGKVKRETLVSSPTRTGGNWHRLDHFKQLVKSIEEGEQKRSEEKARQAAARTAQQQAQQTARENLAEVQAAIRAQQRSEAARISDCQDASLVGTIKDRVSKLLTTGESIEFIAVQQKPLVNISPDAIVATNRRLIFYRPKLLGRYEFYDYLWLDLFNAHIKQNLLGAVFTAQHVSGQVLAMDYLPQSSAQTLYRIAQEREQHARIERRNMQLEQARAGAAQVNVSTNTTAPAQLAAGAAPSGDLAQRLATLKGLFDQGLISAEEFSSRKAEILKQI